MTYYFCGNCLEPGCISRQVGYYDIKGDLESDDLYEENVCKECDSENILKAEVDEDRELEDIWLVLENRGFVAAILLYALGGRTKIKSKDKALERKEIEKIIKSTIVYHAGEYKEAIQAIQDYYRENSLDGWLHKEIDVLRKKIATAIL